MNPPTHRPSTALPPRKELRANAALLIGLFVLLLAMLMFNLHLLFGAWLFYLANFGFGAALLVAGTYTCFHSQSKRLLGLLMVVSGATVVGAALNAEYWSFMNEEAMPIVCEMHDRDGAALAGATCQVIDAASGEPVGEGVANDLGVARFNARLKLCSKVSWLQSAQILNAEYVLRASAAGFRMRDEPLAFQGALISRKEIAVAVALEKSP